MIKLMVVDDEINIRKGLREYISWDVWDIELAAEAEDAESALRIAAQVRPDILLTDIRMRQMNGIELMKRLKEMFPDLRVILLSGYSDIEYLQAALHFKAVEYLLKPAGADKIIEAVLRAKKEILEEREKWQENLKRDAFLDENFPIIQIHFIDEIMKGKHTDRAVIEKKAQMLNIPMEGPFYVVMVADARGNLLGDSYKSGQEQDMKFWQFVQKMNQIVEKYEDGFWCETGEALFLFLLNEKGEDRLGEKCKLLAEEIQAEFDGFGHEKIYMGIGSVVESPLQLCDSFTSAENALLLSAWNSGQYIFYDQRKEMEQDQIQWCNQKEREILSDVTEKRFEKAIEELGILFDIYREQQMDFRKVKKFCNHLVMMTEPFDFREHGENHVEAPCVDEFRDAEDLRNWMIQFWKRKLNKGESVHSQYSELTRKTIRYMQQHYAEDITLQSLSKIVFASPNYLGRVFFNDVGCRLGDWLNRYRVERAKELLSGSLKKTYEIAEEVGFSGYKYFSVCFLKYAGCSARDYRNKYRTV